MRIHCIFLVYGNYCIEIQVIEYTMVTMKPTVRIYICAGVLCIYGGKPTYLGGSLPIFASGHHTLRAETDLTVCIDLAAGRTHHLQ